MPDVTAIGVDVGGTHVRAARISGAGDVLDWAMRSDGRRPGAGCRADRRTGAVAGRGDVASIGIGVPGRVDTQARTRAVRRLRRSCRPSARRACWPAQRDGPSSSTMTATWRCTPNTRSAPPARRRQRSCSPSAPGSAAQSSQTAHCCAAARRRASSVTSPSIAAVRPACAAGVAASRRQAPAPRSAATSPSRPCSCRVSVEMLLARSSDGDASRESRAGGLGGADAYCHRHGGRDLRSRTGACSAAASASPCTRRWRAFRPRRRGINARSCRRASATAPASSAPASARLPIAAKRPGLRDEARGSRQRGTRLGQEHGGARGVRRPKAGRCSPSTPSRKRSSSISAPATATTTGCSARRATRRSSPSSRIFPTAATAVVDAWFGFQPADVLQNQLAQRRHRPGWRDLVPRARRDHRRALPGRGSNSAIPAISARPTSPSWSNWRTGAAARRPIRVFDVDTTRPLDLAALAEWLDTAFAR